jgi:nucleoid-associated protein YgaU
MLVVGIAAMVSLSGCLVSYRDYRSDRTDLDINGNKGCLKGSCEKQERTPAYDLPNKRLTNVLEIELGNHKDRAAAPKETETVKSFDEEKSPVRQTKRATVTQVEETVDPTDEAYANDLQAAKATRLAQVSNTLKADEGIAVKPETATVKTDAAACVGDIAEHTVEAGETLQKISQKYYGTTRYYPAIFETNKDILKTIDSVRAGQKLKIPCK